MKKTLTTACAIMMMATNVALAVDEYQSAPQREQDTPTYMTMFVCYPPISSTEANPATRIYVGHATWRDHGATAYVVHVLADGTRRFRGDQYTDMHMNAREKRDYLQVFWTGRLKSNRHVTIAGNMTAGSNSRGSYTESWFHDGKFTNKVTANCEVEFNGVPRMRNSDVQN